MKLLLHICCAPCSAACIKVLREEEIDVTGYWYNPNIHPFKDENEPLGQQKTNLQKYLQNKGFTDFGKSSFF